MTKIRFAIVSLAAVSLFAAACSGPQAVTEAKSPQAAAVAAKATSSPQSGPASALPPGHPPIDQTSTSAKQPAAPIEPAKDGLTVEQIWKSRESLAGKRVVVRGKVVKFNGGILGVNWIHLQDGSGSADAHTNDITITSDAEAAVGDIITVTGVIELNKDLGSGYSYPVIIEKARIERALNAR